MALILETGEGLTNADSLVSLAEVRAFASSRGKVVSSDDTTLENQIRVAHDYLLANESRFQGYRSKEGQALPFPRCGLWVQGYSVNSNVIPETLKKAVSQLVIEGLDKDAFPAQDARQIITETVGPLTTTYANSGVSSVNPVFPRVDALLSPLFKSQGIRVERA